MVGSVGTLGIVRMTERRLCSHLKGKGTLGKALPTNLSLKTYCALTDIGGSM
jgi:hypothetical protein